MDNIKAIFLDVDGTLVSFNTHQVPQSAKEALWRVHQLGIKIIISTGRSAADLRELVEIPYDAIVALNGADCVLKDGTLVQRQVISLADFQQVESLSRQYGFALAVETNEGIFVNELNETVVKMSALVNHDLPKVENLETVFKRSASCQLCMYCPEQVEQEVMAQLPGLTSSRWNPLLADIQVKGVDKATGVRAFCAYYGLEVSQTMAMGDGGNDIPMLQAAGIGIAMGEASDLVKASADYVTDTVDEDGLQKALLHFGLGVSR